MFRISKDSPAYYLSSVTNDRLKVFQKSNMKSLLAKALNEARDSAGLLIFAYVVMPDHFHVLLGTWRKPSEATRSINGISSRRVIDFLKLNNYESSLRKLRKTEKTYRYLYSLWDHHANLKLITDESVLMQKVNYIHMNPVRAGLVERAEDYQWSSIRCWQRRPLEDEPLLVDIDQIAWRKTEA